MLEYITLGFENVTVELVVGFLIRYRVLEAAVIVDAVDADVRGVIVINGETNVFVIRDVVCTLGAVSTFEVRVIFELYMYVFAVAYPIKDVVCVVMGVKLVKRPGTPCAPCVP